MANSSCWSPHIMILVLQAGGSVPVLHRGIKNRWRNHDHHEPTPPAFHTGPPLTASPMLLSLSRLKHAGITTKSYLVSHRRLLFIISFLLPLCSYLLCWLVLSTTTGFLPYPLRTAKEVLVVVAHPDDECTNPQSMDFDYPASKFKGWLLIIALFFSPSILRTLRSGSGQGNMLVLSAGSSFIPLSRGL
jgi:hypothetical protein